MRLLDAHLCGNVLIIIEACDDFKDGVMFVSRSSCK